MDQLLALRARNTVSPEMCYRWYKEDSRSIRAAQLVWINDHNYLLREVHHQYFLRAPARKAASHCFSDRKILNSHPVFQIHAIQKCYINRLRQYRIQAPVDITGKKELYKHWVTLTKVGRYCSKWNGNNRLTKRKGKLLMPTAIRL